VNELLNEKRALSLDLALRLSTLLDTSPESWLAMQTAVDIWEARQQADLDAIKPLPKRRSA
jgi:antitoxin HigA-1